MDPNSLVQTRRRGVCHGFVNTHCVGKFPRAAWDNNGGAVKALTDLLALVVLVPVHAVRDVVEVPARRVDDAQPLRRDALHVRRVPHPHLHDRVRLHLHTSQTNLRGFLPNEHSRLWLLRHTRSPTRGFHWSALLTGLLFFVFTLPCMGLWGGALPLTCPSFGSAGSRQFLVGKVQNQLGYFLFLPPGHCQLAFTPLSTTSCQVM